MYIYIYIHINTAKGARQPSQRLECMRVCVCVESTPLEASRPGEAVLHTEWHTEWHTDVKTH